MSSYYFDGEENWLEGVTRALKGYADEILSLEPNVQYDIIMSFPPDEVFDKQMPLDNVLIHFEIDNIDNRPLGFGANIDSSLSQYDVPSAGQVTEVEAQMHVINFDIGIWASERAGGGTARLRAYQRLTNAFFGPEAYFSAQEKAGIELQSFSGGQFIMETINDLTVWRVAGMTLVVRAFNKKAKADVPYIQTITSESGITIDDTIVTD